MKEVYFLLYVGDQRRSAEFYNKVLELEPIVDVAGITEFRLREGTVLAVMPVESAAKLIGAHQFPESSPPRSPKCEVYLVVEDPSSYHRRSLDCGGTELSPMQARNWGHRAAYSMDPDGHVLAFAEKVATGTTD
jgi:predicted enzyme related to lactoylglutathione lyase